MIQKMQSNIHTLEIKFIENQAQCEIDNGRLQNELYAKDIELLKAQNKMINKELERCVQEKKKLEDEKKKLTAAKACTCDTDTIVRERQEVMDELNKV